MNKKTRLKKAREASKRRRKEFPEKEKETVQKCRRKLKQEAFEHYGLDGKAICVCCGESNFFFLTLDHINNDGAEYRRANGTYFFALRIAKWPPGLQTLCYNCNCGRRSNGGICPHKTMNQL